MKTCANPSKGRELSPLQLELISLQLGFVPFGFMCLRRLCQRLTFVTSWFWQATSARNLPSLWAPLSQIVCKNIPIFTTISGGPQDASNPCKTRPSSTHYLWVSHLAMSWCDGIAFMALIQRFMHQVWGRVSPRHVTIMCMSSLSGKQSPTKPQDDSESFHGQILPDINHQTP